MGVSSASSIIADKAVSEIPIHALEDAIARRRMALLAKHAAFSVVADTNCLVECDHKIEPIPGYRIVITLAPQYFEGLQACDSEERLISRELNTLPEAFMQHVRHATNMPVVVPHENDVFQTKNNQFSVCIPDVALQAECSLGQSFAEAQEARIHYITEQMARAVNMGATPRKHLTL